jgi:hypothetical protein
MNQSVEAKYKHKGDFENGGDENLDLTVEATVKSEREPQTSCCFRTSRIRDAPVMISSRLSRLGHEEVMSES